MNERIYMKPFVYALSDEARDKCLQLGYTLLKSDGANKIYVFTSNNTYDLEFDAANCKDLLFSNTLTFSM